MRTVLLLALLVGAAGCTLTYTEIGTALPDPAGLEIGVTTKPEVLARLGPPRIVRREFDGDLYVWRRTKSSLRAIEILPVYVQAFFFSDSRSRRDDLSLLFDREGVLRGFGRRLETEE